MGIKEHTLKERIKHFIRKSLEEESGTGAIGVGAGPIQTPYAFSRKGKIKNKATKESERMGYKTVKGMPKKSKVVDYKELWKGKHSSMNEITINKPIQKITQQELKKALRHFDFLGFDNFFEAKQAVLQHEDFAERWDMLRPEDKKELNVVNMWKKQVSNLKEDHQSDVSSSMIKNYVNNVHKSNPKGIKISQVLYDLPNIHEVDLYRILVGLANVKLLNYADGDKIDPKDIQDIIDKTEDVALKSLSNSNLNEIKVEKPINKIKAKLIDDDDDDKWYEIKLDNTLYTYMAHKYIDDPYLDVILNSNEEKKFNNLKSYLDKKVIPYTNNSDKNDYIILIDTKYVDFVDLNESDYDKASISSQASKYTAASGYTGIGGDNHINQYFKESINKIIKQELLKEGSYNQFKKEVSYRTKSEILHKGIKNVKKKIQEINRIVDYTSRIKQELSEGEETLYWARTESQLHDISNMINNLNEKIKKLK
jgi:hypothetical protein